MKVAIIGSRSITDCGLVELAIEKSGFSITHVVSGGAIGVDRCAEKIARIHKLNLTVIKPDWKQHGKKAGMVRNIDIVNQADALIAVWDGVSRGTEHSISLARIKNISVYIEYVFVPNVTPRSNSRLRPVRHAGFGWPEVLFFTSHAAKRQRKLCHIK